MRFVTWMIVPIIQSLWLRHEDLAHDQFAPSLAPFAPHDDFGANSKQLKYFGLFRHSRRIRAGNCKAV